MKYILTRDDLKTLGNGIRNANSMSLEEHLDAFLADKPTTDWQVIASGEVKKDDEQYLWLGNMWSNELEIKISSFIFKKSNYGKNIEIAVRIKEE